MLVLGIDTSSSAVSVALVELPDAEPAPHEPGHRLVAAVGPLPGRRHGEQLAPAVQELMAHPTVRGHGLDGVAVGVGPGPFTGIRVGIVTAAALGDALGVPVAGVCSLDALAAAVGGPVVVVADARRREVYWARYGADGRRMDGPDVAAPAVLAGQLVAGERLAGEGAWLYEEVFAGWPLVDEPRVPPAAALAGCAAVALRAGLPGPLTPLYLRRPDAVEPVATKLVRS